MLDGSAPHRYHLAQNAALILLSFLLLPLSTLVLVTSYVARPFVSYQDAARRRVRYSPHTPTFRPRTILVTGVGMSKGLALARAFYLAGHNVIGADFEPYGVPVCGRFSCSLQKFYRLPKPNARDGSAFYINALLRLVQGERVDLWVSCSGVASAVEDGQAKEVLERRSDCGCIQFDVPTTQMLHEKDTFIAETMRLGLPVPETHNVTSRAAVHKVLHESPRTKKRYIMKSVGMDDASRGDMTVLPRRTLSQTYDHLSRVPIAEDKPWVLQEFVKGKEYCTHALVIENRVKAFVACPSSELLMHYEALPADSALSKAMLRFTQEFVKRSGRDMSGHLSFDFLIEEKITEKGAEMGLVPIECNPRAHTAVVLFEGMETQMADAYLSALKPKKQQKLLRPNTNGYANGNTEETQEEPVMPRNTAKYYWIGHDLIELVIYPLLQLLLRQITLSAYIQSTGNFLEHLLLWRDGTYKLWDPLPAWWMYHVYWPGQNLACILQGRKWSRVNVSTCKMFGC
jgi:catechol O-methyltransferase